MFSSFHKEKKPKADAADSADSADPNASASAASAASAEHSTSRGIFGGIKDTVKGRYEAMKVWTMSDEQLDQRFTSKFFDELEGQFKTGDIILSRGTEAFSLLIRKGTMSTWSHAAMIVRDPSAEVRKVYGIDGEEFLKESVFVFESDTVTHDGRQGGGSQIVPFRKWLDGSFAEYGDNYLVVTRHIQIPAEFEGKHYSEIFPELDPWFIKMFGIGYESSRVELVKSALNQNKGEDMTSVFCSELVAGALKTMGILKSTKNANNYVPRDFTSDQRLNGRDFSVCKPGFSYSKELRVRYRKKADGAVTATITATDDKGQKDKVTLESFAGGEVTAKSDTGKDQVKLDGTGIQEAAANAIEKTETETATH